MGGRIDVLRATDENPAGADAELGAIHALASAILNWRGSLAARHGLTLTDTMVLTTLVGSGRGSVSRASDKSDDPDPEPHPPAAVTAAALAQAVDIASGRLTGTLDRLEAAGLARRVPNPLDRRSVLVTPTEAGRQATRGLDGALRAVVEAADPGLREQFIARLRRLADATDRARTELDGGR